jgi:uncharacterized membrane protein HdeD (DUF308 family)
MTVMESAAEVRLRSRNAVALWWIPAVSGIALICTGLAAIFWPSVTIRALARLGGIALIGSGVLAALFSLAALRYGFDWALLAIEALFSFALGLTLVFLPETTVRALALVLGALLVVGGASKLVMAAIVPSSLGFARRYLLRGLLTLAVGILLIGATDLTMRAVAVLFGAWLISAGTILLLGGFAVGGYSDRTT